MRRLLLAAALLAPAACSSSSGDRVAGLEEKLNVEVAKLMRIEKQQEDLERKLEAEIQAEDKKIRDLVQQLSVMQDQLIQLRRARGGVGGGGDADAVRQVEAELGIVRDNPNSKEVIAAAIQRLRPLSASAAHHLVMEMRDAVKKFNMPLVNAVQQILEGLEPEAAAQELIPVLDEPALQVIAADALGTIGHASAREPLVKALGSENFDFRFAAAESLIRLKGPEAKKAIPVLIDGLDPKYRSKNLRAWSVLHHVTGFSGGYRPYMPDEEKLQTRAKWLEWWQQQGDVFELK